MGKNRKSRSGRNCDGAKITFRPVGQGRVICNQTGVVLGRGKTVGYRAAQGKLLPLKTKTRPKSSEESSPTQTNLPEVKIDLSDISVKCPSCNKWNFGISSYTKVT